MKKGSILIAGAFLLVVLFLLHRLTIDRSIELPPPKSFAEPGLNSSAISSNPSPVDSIEPAIEAVDSLAVSDNDEDSSPYETVFGYQVHKDRNCTIKLHYIDKGDGTTIEAISCEPNEVRQEVYHEYSNEELEVMLYNDPVAAIALGKRLVGSNLKRARELMIRSVALDPNDVSPLVWLKLMAYSDVGESRKVRTAMTRNYVVASVAKALDPNAPDVTWIENELRNAGFNERGFARLKREIQEDLQKMREIQIEVYGESSI